MFMTDVTLKNTKSEILDALNAALEREKDAKRVKADPIMEEKKKNEVSVVEATKVAVTQNIFSEELIKKFNELETAIKVEETRLSELYGVEKELQNLTLVVNTGKDALNKIETDKKEQSDDLQSAIQALKDEYEKKNNELKTEYDILSKSLKTERDREAEEFSYQLKRDRTIENNKWEDQKAVREAVLAENEQKATQILAQAQSKADYLSELEEKVAGIPALIEKETINAVTKIKDELNRDFNHRIELESKDYSNTIEQLKYKAESLTQELNKANTVADSLQAKLDKAYSDIRELAGKTVETSGGVRFINNPNADKQ